MQDKKRTQLRLYRPIETVHSANFGRVWDLAARQGVARGKLMGRISEDTELDILRARETRNIFEQAGVDQDREKVLELKYYLEGGLPSSIDANVITDVCPIVEGPPDGRKPTHWEFRVANSNTTACVERLACMGLVNKFFGFGNDFNWSIPWTEGLNAVTIKKTYQP